MRNRVLRTENRGHDRQARVGFRFIRTLDSQSGERREAYRGEFSGAFWGHCDLEAEGASLDGIEARRVRLVCLRETCLRRGICGKLEHSGAGW